MTARAATRRAGFTLLEMTAVMFAFGVLLAVGVAVVFGARQLNTAGDALGRRVTWRGDLADQFRVDVARATAAPEALGERTAGPACLILRTADDGYVVYQWADAKLTRFERHAGKDTPRPLPWLPDKLAGVFTRTPGDRPVVTLQLTEALKHGPPRRADISAALGGDVR